MRPTDRAFRDTTGFQGPHGGGDTWTHREDAGRTEAESGVTSQGPRGSRLGRGRPVALDNQVRPAGDRRHARSPQHPWRVRRTNPIFRRAHSGRGPGRHLGSGWKDTLALTRRPCACGVTQLSVRGQRSSAQSCTAGAQRPRPRGQCRLLGKQCFLPPLYKKDPVQGHAGGAAPRRLSRALLLPRTVLDFWAQRFFLPRPPKVWDHRHTPWPLWWM